MNIDEAIDAVEACISERNGTDVEKLASVLDQYAKGVAGALLLSAFSYRMNGVGEIKLLTRYDVVDTGLTLDDVMQNVMAEQDGRGDQPHDY